MSKGSIEYYKNVLYVLSKIKTELPYSIEGTNIEYRIRITNRALISPKKELSIIEQLIKKNILTEYQPSDRYKTAFGPTVLDMIAVYFVSVNSKLLNEYIDEISELVKHKPNSDTNKWSNSFRWLSNKEYLATGVIKFPQNNSIIKTIFTTLENEKGGWVNKSKLANTIRKKQHNLNSHFTHLRKKIQPYGLTIEPRNDHSKPSAYRLVKYP